MCLPGNHIRNLVRMCGCVTTFRQLRDELFLFCSNFFRSRCQICSKTRQEKRRFCGVNSGGCFFRQEICVVSERKVGQRRWRRIKLQKGQIQGHRRIRRRLLRFRLFWKRICWVISLNTCMFSTFFHFVPYVFVVCCCVIGFDCVWVFVLMRKGIRFCAYGYLLCLVSWYLFLSVWMIVLFCPQRNIIPARTIIQGGWVSSLSLLRILKNG